MSMRILSERQKGAVTWQARVGRDRGRLEVVGIVRPSPVPTEIELLSERELRELLGESTELTEMSGSDGDTTTTEV